MRTIGKRAVLHSLCVALICVGACTERQLLDGELPDAAVLAADQRLVVSTATVTVSEGGSGSFGLWLLHPPESPLTVGLASSLPDHVTLTPSSWTFDASNYDTPVEIHVGAPVDFNADSEAATVVVHASDVADIHVAVRVDDQTKIVSTGWPQPFSPSSSILINRGTVLCMQVHLDQAGMLSSFGVAAAADAGAYRFAVYSDSNDRPDALVADTYPTTTLALGDNLAPAPEITLPAGKAWMCLRTGQNIALSASTTPMARLAFTDATIRNIDAAWPNPFGDLSQQDDVGINLWFTTHHQ